MSFESKFEEKNAEEVEEEERHHYGKRGGGGADDEEGKNGDDADLHEEDERGGKGRSVSHISDGREENKPKGKCKMVREESLKEVYWLKDHIAGEKHIPRAHVELIERCVDYWRENKSAFFHNFACENYEEFNDEGGSVSEVEHDIQWSKLHKRFQKEFERILEDDLLEDLDIERGEFFAAMESILDGDATQLSSDGRYFVNAVMCSLDYSQFHRLMTQNIQAIMSREMPGMQFGSI